MRGEPEEELLLSLTEFILQDGGRPFEFLYCKASRTREAFECKTSSEGAGFLKEAEGILLMENKEEEEVSHASMPGGVLLSGPVWSRLSLKSLVPSDGGGTASEEETVDVLSKHITDVWRPELSRCEIKLNLSKGKQQQLELNLTHRLKL